MKEQEPAVGAVVLAWFEILGEDVMRYQGKGEFTNCVGFLTDDITHWMPLQDELAKRMGKIGYA